MLNNYYNFDHPLHPYTYSLEAMPGTIPPPNALRGEEPPATRKGFWPCEKNGAFIQVEDHRERSAASGHQPEEYQEGTTYWLPGDVYGTPARKMTDIGTLPEGALLTAPEQSLEEAYAAKYDEIISRSNAVKNFLSSRFSFLEENTWPEQEAGARAILNDADNVKDKVARLILASQTGTANAVALVNQLAIADGVAPEAFAARIIANADLSYQAGIATLMEQRAMESQLNAARTVEEVLSLNVFYSLLAME